MSFIAGEIYGCEVEDPEFRVQGSGFRVQGKGKVLSAQNKKATEDTEITEN